MIDSGLKLSLEEMRRFALRKGGDCLSDSYVNNKTRMLWRCAYGHEWRARPDLLRRSKRPTWCPHCAGKFRKTRDEIAALAVPHGGRLLSDTTKGMQHDVLWRCAEGHVFTAKPNNVKYGHWCPECWAERHGDVARVNGREGHARKRAARLGMAGTAR